MVKHESVADWTTLRAGVLADLSKQAQTVFVELERTTCAKLILNLLHTRPQTFLTVEDVAFYLAQPLTTIERDLQTLIQLQLIQTRQAGNITFYALTQDPGQLQLAHELYAWQNSWQDRLHQLAQLIGNAQPTKTFVAPQALKRRVT